MSLYLEIIEGTNLGSKFKVFPGIRIGRSQADIVLDDPRVSGLHAQVEKNNKGQLVMVDRNSSNGLWINYQRVSRVTLLPGVSFYIGKTLFKVIDYIPGISQALLKGGFGWELQIMDAMQDVELQNKPEAQQTLKAFKRPVQLKFTTGLHTGREILLGFGPRSFGKREVDFLIQEPTDHSVFFSLEPLENGALLMDQTLGQIKVNKKVITQCYLQADDEITIGNTIIKLSYL